MIVFNPLSLYTTYLGWQQYDIIYSALWQVGILFWGFIFIAFRYLKNILVPAEDAAVSTDRALNQFLFELASAFLLCAVFVFPSIALQQKGLAFKPICSLGGVATKDSLINDSGTTYDEAFADVLAEQVKIPLGFNIAQNFSSSLTYGLMKETGCSDSLQAIKADLVSTHIPRAEKKQILDFHHQCFLEAKTQYLNKPLSPADQKKANKIMEAYGGDEDLNWVGSQVLQTFYYPNIKSSSPVSGFSYNSYPSAHFDAAGKEDKAVDKHKPTDGYPPCDVWWNKIRGSLVELSEKASFTDEHLGRWNVQKRVFEYRRKHRIAWGSKISADDFIARVLLEEGTGMQITANDSLLNNTNDGFGKNATRSLVNTGQWFKSWTTTPLTREATVQTLPVMQAFFYFFLIVLTPFVLSLSGYSPKAVGSLVALFFMSIFIQYLWHLGGFLERATVNSLGENNTVTAIQNVMVSFYYIAPLILLKLSTHFGGEGAAVLSDLLSESNKHAKDQANTAQGIVKTGIKVASKGAIR